MSEELTFLPEGMTPGFDYSNFDEQTVEDLHLAENQYQSGKKMAARGYVMMGAAVSIAHDALCGTVVARCDNGQFAKKEDTFRQWCLSIGVTKDTAYRLLQISNMFDSSSAEQQKILKELPPTLLYAAAKPSAPEELVNQVKNGDITTHKQYQEMMEKYKAEKQRADAAEAREEEAWRLRESAAQKYNAVLADIDGLKEQNSNLSAQKEQAEQRARTAEEALKKQPITAVVDKEEVARQAKAQSQKQVQAAEQAKNAALERLAQMEEAVDGYLSPGQAAAQQAKTIANSIRSMYIDWLGRAASAELPLTETGASIYEVCSQIQSSLLDGSTIPPTAAGSTADAEREELFE